MKESIHPVLIFFAVFILASCTARITESPSADQSDFEQLAQKALMVFLEDLHEGKYVQAVYLYGGNYEIMMDHNPDLDPNDHAALLQNACTINGAQCLEVKSAVLDREVSATEFDFRVEFLTEDGSLFTLGPCCGGNETDSPPQTSFNFTVNKDGDGRFLVMNMPPYMP
jgi:hypothetical protein